MLQHKMNGILVFLLFFVICGVTETYGDEDQNLLYHYNGMEQQETLKNYFDIAFDDIKRKEGFDSVFIVKGNVEQIVDFDDEWKVQITVFRSDTADGEYTEYLKFSAIGVCNFMKTVFKKYIYSSMKDCANLPDPDTCPVTKAKYHSECEFDAKIFRRFSKPGFYMIKVNLLNNGENKTGIIVRGSLTEK